MALFSKRKTERGLEPPVPDEDVPLPIGGEELVVVSSPRCAQTEQYRRLANSVDALNPDGAPRTLLLTSALPNEGKTTAAINLGLALCERPHMRTVLIDADLRRPSLEASLGLPRRQGFTELLQGKLTLDESLRKTSVDGLYVIGAGEAPDNPSKLLRIDRVKSLLFGLKQRFDYVLLDAPPAHAVNEPHLMGAATDGVLLVVRLTQTPKHLVAQTSAQLEAMGGNLLGMCLVGAKGGADFEY